MEHFEVSNEKLVWNTDDSLMFICPRVASGHKGGAQKEQDNANKEKEQQHEI